MVASYPLSSLAPTHVEVELGCDNWICVDNCDINNGADAGLTGGNIGCLHRWQNKTTNYSDLNYIE